MFIETEGTADPARLRFLPGREVLAEGTLNLRSRGDAAISPLAERLFAIPGIKSISLTKDAIIVTKEGVDWRHLKPPILGAIMDHFVSGMPVLRERAVSTDQLSSRCSTDTAVDSIWTALRRVIDPELGCNIVDLGLVYNVTAEEGGVAHIIMTTTTAGCPAANYLKKGAAESVRALPGVEDVEVTLTYEPHWFPELMSDEAKRHFHIRKRI